MQNTITKLGEGSKYYGYKNLTAIPSLNYYVYEKKEFLEPIPISSQFKPFADHMKILSDLNICDYVDNKGVKQVWVYMYHNTNVNRYPLIAPIESNMAGPYGDISNSYRQPDLPVCNKTYVVIDYNYGRGISEALENHCHQFEAVFNYVDKTLFWDNFVGGVNSNNTIINPGCGWTHTPPNGIGHYSWNLKREVLSDCEDWNPDRTGEKKLISCVTWAGEGCGNDPGTTFKVWWMQNIPGKNNNLYSDNKKLRDWWEFIGDFDKAMSKGKNFIEP